MTLFAEATKCAALWQDGLKGWNVMESEVVKEWTAQARKEGELRGELRGKVEMLVVTLTHRFGEIAPDLKAAIEPCTDGAKFREWSRQAIQARSLARFRKAANL